MLVSPNALPDLNAAPREPSEVVVSLLGEQTVRQVYVEPTEVGAIPATPLTAGGYDGHNQDPTGWRP
jgi:hypothetical protein